MKEAHYFQSQDRKQLEWKEVDQWPRVGNEVEDHVDIVIKKLEDKEENKISFNPIKIKEEEYKNQIDGTYKKMKAIEAQRKEKEAMEKKLPPFVRGTPFCEPSKKGPGPGKVSNWYTTYFCHRSQPKQKNVSNKENCNPSDEEYNCGKKEEKMSNKPSIETKIKQRADKEENKISFNPIKIKEEEYKNQIDGTYKKMK